jgi:hypothetical protein
MVDSKRKAPMAPTVALMSTLAAVATLCATADAQRHFFNGSFMVTSNHKCFRYGELPRLMHSRM